MALEYGRSRAGITNGQGNYSFSISHCSEILINKQLSYSRSHCSLFHPAELAGMER